MFENARKYYDIMYAVQNTKKYSPWKSKVYLPILASKAWDLIAQMSDVVPFFNVAIQGEVELDDETGNFQIPETTLGRQKRIEAKLQKEYLCQHDEPMKLKVFDPLVDAVVTGTGYAYASWAFEEKRTYARQWDETGTMDNTARVAKTTKQGHNEFEGINYFNVFPAEAKRWGKMPYLIVRGRETKSDLESSGLYVDLDKCQTDLRYDTEFEAQNVSRDRVANEAEIVSPDDSLDMITYYECYERTAEGITLTTYAEGRADATAPEDTNWVEIRPTSMPYWHDKYPVVPFYLRKKSYSVFGESLFENNRTLQSATNDLFNHYLDNWNLSIESMIMYEDGTLTNDFIIEPGGEITFTGTEPKQFKFPEPNPTQLSAVMSVIERGVDAATFSPYAAGTPNDGNDKTQGTAYGVRRITEAATTKIGFFRDNFKQSMKTVGSIWLSNLQQFADDPEEIKRVDQGRVVPDLIMPSDYQGEMELDIDDDSMIPLSKADKRDMSSQLTQELIALQNQAMQQAAVFKTPADVPRFNFVEISREKAELYSVRDFDRLLLDNNVEVPPEQPPDPKEFINMSYKDAPPDIQAQIEEGYGFQPSSMHDTNLVTQAAEAGAKQGQLENPMIGDASGTGQPGNNQAGATA